MAWQESEQSSGCFGRNQRRRVRPLSAGTSHTEQIEVRPRRVLRIQLINAQPRDPKFDKEMKMQKQYRTQGMVTGGPLSMPRNKQIQEIRSSVTATPAVLPNSVDGSGVLRQVSASGTKKEVASASGVALTVNNTPQGGTPVTSPVPVGHTADEQENADENKSQNYMSSFQAKPSPKNVKGSEVNNVPKEDSADIFTQHHMNSLAIQPNGTVNKNITSPRPSTMLFFIHGVGGSSDVWHAQIRYFARLGYEIVAPDLIGHGMSHAPKDAKAYHFKEIVADLEEIFDRYCKRRNIIIGHSYGCSFAAVLGRVRSRRVHKLVLISGGAPTPLAPQPGIFAVPTCMLKCFRPCLDCGFHKSAFHAQRKPVLEKEEAFSIPTNVLQHTMNGQQWPDGDELYHQWLLCPVLLLYGAQDKLVSLQEEEHMAEIIFRSRLEVIPDASHMLMIEAPDEVNTLLLHFIAEDSTLPTSTNTPQPTTPQRRPSTPQQPPLDHDMHSPQRSASRMSTKSYKTMPVGHFT